MADGTRKTPPVMPFYALNLKSQQKVAALEDKWQVHFEWLADVVSEAKVKFSKPGEERELSLLGKTPGSRRTRTARTAATTRNENKTSRTTKAAQKDGLSALEENELASPQDRKERPSGSVGDQSSRLSQRNSESSVEVTNEGSQVEDNQQEAKDKNQVVHDPPLEPAEGNDEISAKNDKINDDVQLESAEPSEDETLQLVLENTNEFSDTITEESKRGEDSVHKIDDGKIDENSLDTEENHVSKSNTIEIDDLCSLANPSEDGVNGPETDKIEIENVESIEKSYQSQDTTNFVDDVFETSEENENIGHDTDVQNDGHLHVNRKHNDKSTNSIISQSSSVGTSVSASPATFENATFNVSPAITSQVNATFNVSLALFPTGVNATFNVSPAPSTEVNATFTVDEEIEFRRESDENMVNSTFTVNTPQMSTGGVEDNDRTVSVEDYEIKDKNENGLRQKSNPMKTNDGLNTSKSRLSKSSRNYVEVKSPGEKMKSPTISTDSSIEDEQDTKDDEENSEIEADSVLNKIAPDLDADDSEKSGVKSKPDTSVSSQEDDKFTSSPTPGFSASENSSQDEDINTSKASEKQDRSPSRSGKSVIARASEPTSNVESPQQHVSLKERESSSPSSRYARNRSQESVSSDNQENPPSRPSSAFSQNGEKSSRPNDSPQQKSVRSTRSRQRVIETYDELEKENSSAKPKNNPTQDKENQQADVQKNLKVPSSSSPGDSHSSDCESDRDEVPSTKNVRKSSSRRSSIARSLLKVSAARQHSVVEMLQTMEGSLVTLVSTDSPAKATAGASKSNATSQTRAKAGKVAKPKKAATRGPTPASRGVTPGSGFRNMNPGRTTPGGVGGNRTTPGGVGGNRTTPGSVGGSRTTPGSVGSHNGGRVRSRLGIMEKATRGTPEKAAEALKKKEELMKQKTEEQRSKREAKIKRVQEARQAKENEVKKKNEAKEAEEKVAAQAKKDRKIREEAERRRIVEEKQKEAEDKKAKEEQAMIALAAELKKKEAALEAELKNKEAAEHAKKIRSEEKKRRERKEEERRMQAEAKKKETERIAREKEKMRKAQAQEVKENSQLNSTYTKPSSSLDQSKSAGPSSYNMTPSRHAGNLPPEPLENENNYGLDDLDSEGSTDDEDQPRKEVPKWAEGGLLRTALLKQSYMGPDLDAIFAPIEMPELAEMFDQKRKRFFKRTSSAVWGEAPTSFKHGQR